MEAYIDTLCLLAQPKEGQQQFKNKKQPELTENRTDNQGVKEETFTLIGIPRQQQKNGPNERTDQSSRKKYN